MPKGTFLDIACGQSFSLGLRSDGQVLAWGINISGQCNVPPLPGGVVYVDVAGGNQLSVAVRSDGAVAEWGSRNRLHPPPWGLRYLKVATDRDGETIALRSDGAIDWLNTSGGGVPVLPPGVRYVEVAAGLGQYLMARRSDGAVIPWAVVGCGPCNPPTLPAGMSYVEIAAGRDHAVARRSDGSVVVWGDNTYNQHRVPAFVPGTGIVQIASLENFTVGMFAAGAFNWFGVGCPGTGGVSQLSAVDLPRVGQTFRVGIAPQPPGAAWLLTGASNTSSAFGALPFDLTFLGLTGCLLRVSSDIALPISGSPARASVPIPNDPALAGQIFHQQALVLDTGVNPFGAVLSDAVSAVVGQ